MDGLAAFFPTTSDAKGCAQVPTESLTLSSCANKIRGSLNRNRHGCADPRPIVAEFDLRPMQMGNGGDER